MLKKKLKTLFNSITNTHLEVFSYIMLLLWTTSPLVEYIFKITYSNAFNHYFSIILYIIGSLGILTYIIYFIKYTKKEKFNIKKFIPELLLIILIIISIISSFLSKNPHLSFFGEAYRKEGLFVYIMYVGIILMSSIIKSDEHIKQLYQSIIIIGFIISIHPLFKSNFTYTYYTNVFGNPNHYGYYLMINTMTTIFMFINSNKVIKKIIYALIYIFFLYLLIRNDTFGSYLAISITLLFLLIYSIIKKYKIKNTLLIIILFVTTSFFVSKYDIKIGEKINPESNQNIISSNITTFKNDLKGITSKDTYAKKIAGSYRGLLWTEAWKYTLEHPFFGGGMECLQDYYMTDRDEYYSAYNTRPHNSILEVSSFIGIPGAIIYLTLIIYIALTNIKIMKKDTLHIMVYCMAMCYFISSMFGNSMYYTSPYFMILLGSLIGYTRNNKN